MKLTNEYATMKEKKLDNRKSRNYLFSWFVRNIFSFDKIQETILHFFFVNIASRVKLSYGWEKYR